QGRADAAAMRQDQVALEGRGVGGVDLDRRQLSEAGVDAVDRLVAGRDGGDAGSALVDGRVEGAVERHGLTLPVDGGEIGERDLARTKGDGHAMPPCERMTVESTPPRMRARSGLKPMR